MSEPGPLAAWMDRFLAAYYQARPVNATFIGVHDHDHRLPDFGEDGSGDVVAAMRTLLSESDSIEASRLSGAERIDLALARGFLRAQIWEFGAGHFHRGNPSVYTGEAIFGVMALFLTEFASLAQRTRAAIARMEAIPDFLAQGRRNVRRAPRAWTERAVRECTGAQALFTEGLDLLAESVGIGEPGFKAAAGRAAAAFANHRVSLEQELLPRAREAVGCGPEALELYLREGHFLTESADEIVRYAEAELAAAKGELRARAASFGAATPEEALLALAEIHPEADAYYACYASWWDEVRARVVARDLLTWPDLPLRFVPQPAWTRAAAPYLYFLPYRAPAAHGGPAVHRHLVPSLESLGTPGEVEAFLRANNTSVIKLNHVVHHGGLGHHVQNARARGARSRIGRIAGVDGASRIALFCGGTMTEGWACYATDLAGEVGLLTPLELYEERHTRLRMCARAVVDVRLHEGRFTLEEGARYYRQQAGMSEAAARAEVVKNSMFPGAAVIYVTGGDAIHRLRRELSSRPAFHLRAFHDELLSYGSVPVALVAAAMRRGANDVA